MDTHHHFHKIHLLKDELSEVYWNLAIQSFGLSLISIFIPIYLLQLGYTVSNVLLFMIFYFGMVAVFSPLSALFANKFGFKHVILFRTPLLLAFMAGLYFLPNFRNIIFFIAIVGGIAGSLYWISINSIFSKASDKKHRGKQVGKLVSLPSFASLLGPLIGGFVAVAFGMDILLIISFVILLVSPIPLFFTKEVKPHVKFSLKKLMTKEHAKFLKGFLADGPRFVAGAILWPIFVYIILNDTVSVGIMATLGSVGVILFTVYIGKISDKINRNVLLRLGGILGALIWSIRIFAKQAWHVFVLTFCAGMFTVLIDVPFIAMSFDKASKDKDDAFIVFRELGLGFGRVITLVVLMFVFQTFIIGFSLSGLASLVFTVF